MSKRIRQYIGIAAAIAVYYLIHEGAHLIFALCSGVFRQVKFMGLGVQVDVSAELMSDRGLAVFCLVGAAATLIAAYLMVTFAESICRVKGKVLRASAYYITIALLMLDPLYLSVLCGFFGGGDMNGISLLIPEIAARCIFGVLVILNGIVFWKKVLPVYKASFAKAEAENAG